jgi:hypothetical protein
MMFKRAISDPKRCSRRGPKESTSFRWMHTLGLKPELFTNSLDCMRSLSPHFKIKIGGNALGSAGTALIGFLDNGNIKVVMGRIAKNQVSGHRPYVLKQITISDRNSPHEVIYLPNLALDILRYIGWRLFLSPCIVDLVKEFVDIHFTPLLRVKKAGCVHGFYNFLPPLSHCNRNNMMHLYNKIIALPLAAERQSCA